MKSVIASVFLAALAGLAEAKVILTNTNFDDIEVGKPFQITWADAEGPVTVTLKSGTENDLKTVSQITSGSTSGSASWTPEATLSGNYAFEITDGIDINYSQMFALDGTPSATTASSAASGSSTTGYSATSASSTLSTITTGSSASASASSTGSASTSSASSGSPSSSSPASSSAAASSSSPASSSASATSSSTRSASSTSASATTTSSATPNNNDAQGVVAPLFAPLLVALGAALL